MSSVPSEEIPSVLRQRSKEIPQQKKQKSKTINDDGVYGVLSSGEKFKIPETLDTIDLFLPPNTFTLGSIIALIYCSITVILTFFGRLPIGFFVGWSIFWRCCYNIGLGYLLDAQSKRQQFSRAYLYYKQQKGVAAWVLDNLASSTLKEKNYKIEELPNDFKAWLVFTQLVNFVLINDSTAYAMLAYKCWTWPITTDAYVVGQYIIGFFLIIFNCWAKIDAHRCIGKYCWYWGDFFFIRKNFNLKFDGIFELFPHPMYTVGYALYYGVTLLSRSYIMFFVSLNAHLLQMAFLSFVEEPHIKKTYPTQEKINPDKYRMLYDVKTGLFPRKRDSIFLLRLSWLNSTDFSLIVFVIYGSLFSLVVSDKKWCVVQVIVWRLIHWLGLGGLLFFQSNYRYFTEYHKSRGRTLHEAFSQWKAIYNLSLTMNATLFVICAYRHFETPMYELMTPLGLARLLLCFVLILFTWWVLYSTYQTAGDFGWFYGDFFVSTDAYQQPVNYTGIYRFLNNPDCVAGYAGLYGLALLTQSWTILSLSALSQGLNVMFVSLVEIPHMKKLNREFRDLNPFQKRLRSGREKAKKKINYKTCFQKTSPSFLETQAKQKARLIRLAGMKEIHNLYTKLSSDKQTEDSNAGVKTKLDAPKEAIIGQPLTVTFETKDGHSEWDWIGVYPVDTPSVPGMSLGRWVFVNCNNAKGSVIFPLSLLPNEEGVYHLRYHLDKGYDVVSSRPIIFMKESDKKVE